MKDYLNGAETWVKKPKSIVAALFNKLEVVGMINQNLNILFNKFALYFFAFFYL